MKLDILLGEEYSALLSQKENDFKVGNRAEGKVEKGDDEMLVEGGS